MVDVKKPLLAITLALFMSTLLVFPACATEDSWEIMEPMPTVRTSFGVAVVDGKIYAIGGSKGNYLDVNEMYDPAADTWITKKPMPTPRTSFGIAVYNNKIFVFGGIAGPINSESSGITGITEVYDPSLDSWETKTLMPTPRASLSASVVNNKIYLIGGIVHTNQDPLYYNSTNVVEVYDPETDTWTTKKNMPTVLDNYAAVVKGNNIHLFGGLLSVAGPWYPNLSCANRIYDPENDTWTSGKSIPSIVVSGAAASTTGLLAPKRIYVIGGWNGDEIHGTNLTRIYDPEKDEWTQGLPMSTPRAGMGIAVVNDELYVIGGTTGSGILGEETILLATNEKYTPIGYIPEFPTWTILPLLLVTTLVVVVCRLKLTKNNSFNKKEMA
jgi:N-acetylneuraminic acid mutarotase